MKATKLDTEIKDIKEYNAIAVGGPCANKIAAKLMNNPKPCWEAIPYGKPIVKLFEHENGNTALLIAGRTAEETRKAVREVMNSG